MGRMKGITIKLPEAVVRQLKEQARQSGRSIAALIRERIAAPPSVASSVYAISADLAGSLDGSGVPAANRRRRFRRS
jgi:predicted transcriptional regulator